MAEQIKKSLEQILNELFEDERKTKRDGKVVREDSSLKKYAKVRWVRYEIGLHMRFGLPLEEVNGNALTYFSKRFLDGESAYHASTYDLEDGYKRLGYAVNACQKKCSDLVVELNEALSSLGLDEVRDIQKFLDFLTYDLKIRTDYEGKPVMDKPYDFPIVDSFANRDNLKEFTKEIRSLLKAKKMIPMQEIYWNVYDNRQIKLYKNRIAARAKKAASL